MSWKNSKTSKPVYRGKGRLRAAAKRNLHFLADLLGGLSADLLGRLSDLAASLRHGMPKIKGSYVGRRRSRIAAFEQAQSNDAGSGCWSVPTVVLGFCFRSPNLHPAPQLAPRPSDPESRRQDRAQRGSSSHSSHGEGLEQAVHRVFP